MAVDSRQKRMSAMNIASPWRGPMVDATVSGFDAGNRQAAAFMYSGIVAGGSGTGGDQALAVFIRRRVRRPPRSLGR